MSSLYLWPLNTPLTLYSLWLPLYKTQRNGGLPHLSILLIYGGSTTLVCVLFAKGVMFLHFSFNLPPCFSRKISSTQICSGVFGLLLPTHWFLDFSTKGFISQETFQPNTNHDEHLTSSRCDTERILFQSMLKLPAFFPYTAVPQKVALKHSGNNSSVHTYTMNWRTLKYQKDAWHGPSPPCRYENRWCFEYPMHSADKPRDSKANWVPTLVSVWCYKDPRRELSRWADSF